MDRILRKKNKLGFTLIELVIVIAILAILAAILAPLLVNYIQEAKQAVADANARTLYTAATSAAALLLAEGTVPASITNETATTDPYAEKVNELLGTGFDQTGSSWSITVTGSTAADISISTSWTDGTVTGTH